MFAATEQRSSPEPSVSACVDLRPSVCVWLCPRRYYGCAGRVIALCARFVCALVSHWWAKRLQNLLLRIVQYRSAPYSCHYVVSMLELVDSHQPCRKTEKTPTEFERERHLPEFYKLGLTHTSQMKASGMRSTSAT